MTKLFTLLPLALIVAASTIPTVSADSATLGEAVKNGKASFDFNLRYEMVEQDNPLDDADALTIRSRIGYTTDAWKNISGMLEFEDSRVVAGISDYNDGLGSRPEYSVIADPETTELDQAFVQYKNSLFSARLGRQVVLFDNHRFIGHVGWRQDRQTFDGISFAVTPLEALTLSYAYLEQRNRIFAEATDLPSKDHLLHASYKMATGTLSAYSYLLEVDEQPDNALDTYGLRFAGLYPLEALSLTYAAEFATQSADTTTAEFDADYYMLEGGVVISGITVKAGYEVLGSDGGDFGFSTPLATLHAFNGWADQFLATPATGLQDMSLTLAGALAGGTWTIMYHDFQADESSAGVDDLGSEIDASYARPFAEHYVAGLKYAAYSAGDEAAGKVDTDKLWFWLGATF